MNKHNKDILRNFYIDHLKNQILNFWIPTSIDTQNGGFLNCFDNSGEKLLSHDKYTWSQGRFIWLFAELASDKLDIFTSLERNTFLEYSRQGVEFLEKSVFINNEYKCVFLMDREGNHIPQGDERILDSSIFADCFVVSGFAKYSAVSKEERYYRIAVELYKSIIKRIEENHFNLLPYSCPKGYRMHSIPMICLNISNELYYAARVFEDDTSLFESNMRLFYEDILNNFVDEENLLHEMILDNNTFTNTLLGRYINPGHTLEDIWFILEAAQCLNDSTVKEKCYKIIRNTIETGWDKEYGGIRLFVDKSGTEPKGSIEGIEKDPMIHQVINNCNDKLWWVHSESLYTLLLAFIMTNNYYYYNTYKKIHQYTFETFPNPDKSVGEWIQIRKRDGSPEDKVVALPVKDPYHIARNLIKIIELLS